MFKKYSKYIYSVLIFYFVWLVVFPLSISLVIKPISSAIFQKIGYNIKAEKIKIRTSVLPDITLTTEEIALLNKDNSKAFESKNVKLKLKILPLIIGKLHIKRFSADLINANFVLKDKLYLGDYKLPDTNPEFDIQKFKLNNLCIKQYEIVLKDNGYDNRFWGNNLKFKNGKKSLVFIMHSGMNNSTKIDCDISIPKNNNHKKSKCNVVINNLNLDIFSKIVSIYFPNIKSTKGLINLTSKKDDIKIKIKDFKIVYNDEILSIIFPKLLELHSKFYIYNNTLDIKNCRIKSDGILTELSGKIKNIFSSSANFDIKTKILKSDLRQCALMLPNIITEDIDTTALKKYPFYANMTGKLNITGKLPEPDIKGELYIPDGMIIKPIAHAKSKAKIKLNFIGQKVVIDVDVPVNYNEWVKVDGDINLYGEKYANLDIHSSDSVDLDTAEFVLNPLHEIFRFEIGPVPIMDIKGQGGANLKIVGTKKDPHAWGKFTFYNTDARFLEVNKLILKNAKGHLDFNDRMAYFINDTGTINGKRATIEGTCSLFGDFDFNVTAYNQKLEDLITILTTSPMLISMKNTVPPIKHIKGNADFILNLKGNKVLHIKDLELNKNVIPKGSIKLLGNEFFYENMKMKNVKGLIQFYRTEAEADIKGKLSTNSDIKIKGKLKEDLADINISAPKIAVNELNIKELKFLDNFAVMLKAKYKGSIKKVAIGGIDAEIQVLKNSSQVKNCKISSGNISLKHSNLIINNLNGYVKHNPFYINLSAKNIGRTDINFKNAHINGSFRCKNLDLTVLNSLKNLDIFSDEIKTAIEKIEVVKGITDVNADIKNNHITSILNLDNIYFTYSLKEGAKQELVKIPVKLINGQLRLKNNTVTLKKFNCLIDEMPILLFGKIENIYKNPKYNMYINSKLTQQVFTKYWNAYNIYPIKVNGDIVSTIRLSGDKKHTQVNSETRLEENSEIYYMGAKIGDLTNPIVLKFDTDIFSNQKIKINKFSYNKIISSQNNKQNELPLLNISGEIRKNGRIYHYKNLVVKSENPADANLFNVIFKKPTIKQGTFLSDLNISGSSTNLKILGKFHLSNVEMPYLNTTIKDLSVDFTPDKIKILSKGEILSNYIMGSIETDNKLTPPYTINKAYVYINNLDINHVMAQIKQLELKGLSSAIATDTDVTAIKSLDLLRIKSAKIRAGQIRVKNIFASNLEATCGFNNKNISINSFNFNMANGIISGNLDYNLKNNYLDLSLSANKVNANSLTIALFDLPNQIYGDLTGNIELSCDTTDEKSQKQTFNGQGQFRVVNGKMPKLGSLEYLLKAGNLLKGGITSISMNSIIDIITPLKTGEFSIIHGHFNIKNGIANTVEIHSHGKNLSLYITGKYNFIDSIANMNVYGQISRKVSTVLGTAGNISLNTLFNKIPGVSTSQFINDLNKIPGIDLSNKSNRKFIVEILGDINGENFVKSFKWLN